MVNAVENAVENRRETQTQTTDETESGLVIQMMGQLRLYRDDHPVELPRSRKVRALLGYLALAEHGVGRSRLCELLGNVSSDPRGDLRWYLSKLRSLLDHPGSRRIETNDDMVSLNLYGATVDALEIDLAVRAGLHKTISTELRRLLELFAGDFLEGLDLNRSPQLDHWLTTQRRHFRFCHAAVLDELVSRLPTDHPETRRLCEKWVALAPFELRAHCALLSTLPQAEGKRQLAAAVRLFEAEQMDPMPLRLTWQAMRAAPPVVVIAEPSTVVTTKSVGIGVSQRASLAVLPFRELDADPTRMALGAGLTRDIITRLAKLRVLFVIAQGSVFALAERGVGSADAAQRLDVDYVASGAVQRRGGRISVAVELVEACNARIIWSDMYDAAENDAFDVLEQIGDTIVCSIASEVETAERNRAILKPPNSLNAWEAYHRGLWHMYRFTRTDNQQAQQYFSQSIQTDPTFARAHSGLSFTHWQNAFQGWEDRRGETGLAFAAAQRSLMIDDHDPSAHWAMGRALWLHREQAQAIAELEQSVDLSPNFALGHYSLSFVHSQAGDPLTAIDSADRSQRLSPFDPLLFGMFGAKAMACVRLGKFEEAADLALKALARPNSHAVIQQIAAFCLALAGRDAEARSIAVAIRNSLPDYRIDIFFRTFNFPADVEALFHQGAARIGLA